MALVYNFNANHYMLWFSLSMGTTTVCLFRKTTTATTTDDDLFLRNLPTLSEVGIAVVVFRSHAPKVTHPFFARAPGGGLAYNFNLFSAYAHQRLGRKIT